MRVDDVADDGQRARHHVESALAPRGRECEWIFFPACVLATKARLDLGTGETFPAPVVDLAKTRVLNRRERVRCRDDARRLAGALQRAAVDGDHAVVAKAFGEPRALCATFIRQRP